MTRSLIRIGVAVLAASLGYVLLTPSAMAAAVRQARLDHPASGAPPVTITVQTVPTLPGVSFAFDGAPLVTNAQGQASVTEAHNFDTHTLALTDVTIVTPDRHYRFARWAGQRDPDQAFRAQVGGLPMRANYMVTAAFNVQCPVKPRLTDRSGRALNPRRVSRLTLKSDTGQQLSIPPARRSWLDCLQPVYRKSMLSTRVVTYSVQSAIVSGTNIVSSGVQRFRPRYSGSPAIAGYFHNLTITAHDALFGGQAGSKAKVTLPNGSVWQVPLGPGHTATLRHLPQGQYQVQVVAGGAFALTDDFRLSRSKRVDLMILSPADLAAIGGALLAAAVGIPLLSTARRKRWRDLLHARREEASSA